MTPPQSRSLAGRGAPDVAFRADFRKLEVQARDLLGRFGVLQGEMKTGFGKMAVQAQLDIVQILKLEITSTGRPQRKTQYLITAMESSENRAVSFDGFVIGTKAALDHGPVASYYRNLEEGTSIFVGRELTGFFLAPAGQPTNGKKKSLLSGPSNDRRRRDVRLIQTAQFYAGTLIHREQVRHDAEGNSYTRSDSQYAKVKTDGTVLGKTSSSEAIRRQKAKGNFRPAQQAYGRSSRPLESPHPNTGRHKIIIRRPITAYKYFKRGGQIFLRSGFVEPIIAKIAKDAKVPYTEK